MSIAGCPLKVSHGCLKTVSYFLFCVLQCRKSCSGDYIDNEYEALMALVTEMCLYTNECVFVFPLSSFPQRVSKAKGCFTMWLKDCRPLAVGWTAVVGDGRNWPRTASVSLKINLALVAQMCVYDTINCVLISCSNE